jgi:hypothetical protein
VTHAGDINAYGKINIVDIVKIAIAFGAQPENSNGDPNADTNGDNIINILDMVVTAIHFGENWATP